MNAATLIPTGSKSQLVVTRDATDRLLKAVKEKMLREQGKLDFAKLRRSGYAEDLITRLKEV